MNFSSTLLKFSILFLKTANLCVNKPKEKLLPVVETGSLNLHLKQDRFHRNPYTNLVKILKETGETGMGKLMEKGPKKWIFAAAAGLGVFIGFRYLFPLIAPFLLSFCIVFLCNPWLNRVQRKTHIRKEILLAGMMGGAAVLLLVLVWILLQCGLGQFRVLTDNWDGMCEQVRYFFGDCCLFAQEHFGVDAVKVEQVVLERVEVFIENLKVDFFPKMIGESWWYLKKIISAVAFLGVSFIASILLCKDYDGMVERLQEGGEGAQALEKVFGIGERIIHLVAVYLKAQVLILLVIMVICCLGLWIGKVGNGLILGILAGILDALPFIGTGIVLMPTAFWQLVNGRIGGALLCVVLYVACMGAREFLEPKLMGKKTGIYPVFMLLSVYTGVKLFGVSGIIKGPLAMVILMEIWKYLWEKESGCR